MKTAAELAVVEHRDGCGHSRTAAGNAGGEGEGVEQDNEEEEGGRSVWQQCEGERLVQRDRTTGGTNAWWRTISFNSNIYM